MERRHQLLLLLFVVSYWTMSAVMGCSECPAGSGVVRVCTRAGDGNDTIVLEETQCEPCLAGSTFSDSPSHHSACRACRTCPPNSVVKRECNVTHDAECECEAGHYAELSHPSASAAAASEEPLAEHARHKHGQPVLSCKACDLCPHGYGAARACSSSHNTVCRKCPASTYSSVLSSSAGCSVCTVCREDQVTLHECTPIQDTVCADKDMGHPSRRVITKSLDPLVHQQQAEEEYNNEGIISVYCAILGAIVLGLLIYVVMKQWRLRKAANKLAYFDPRHHGGSASVPLNGTLTTTPPSPAGKTNHHHHHIVITKQAQQFIECEISPSGSRRLQSADGSRGSADSEFNAVVAPGSDGCSRELKPITQETRLREICTAKRREMEAMLNGRRDHHDWKALARDLGYTSTRIASFEQRSLEKQTGPTRHLFGDWAKREDSTVQNLITSLVNIGRHDVTLVLLPFMAQQQQPSVTTARSATTLPRTSNRSYKPISIV